MVIAWLQQIINRIEGMMGGTTTLAELGESHRQELDLVESSQSGSTDTDGSLQTLYEETGDHPFIFEGGQLYIPTLGDHVIIIYEGIRIEDGGGYLGIGETSYTNVNHEAIVTFGRRPARFGYRIQMEMTFGTGERTIRHHWFDSKRGA